MKALIFRILHQIKNDKRTLGLLLFAPLLVLTLVYFITGNTDYVPKVKLDNMQPAFVSAIKDEATVVEENDSSSVDTLLKDQKIDAYIWNAKDGLHIKMLEQTSKTAIVTKAVKNALIKINPKSNNMHTEFIYSSSDDSYFSSIGFVFLGIISFFFIFIISGMSLVRERFGQTLERLLMTPIRRFKVIGGYTIGYGIFATIQSIIVLLYCHYVLGLQIAGSMLLCMVVMILMAFVAVSTGALASIFANSEFQVVQFIPIIIIPQIFFSGLIPIDTIPYGLGNLCYIMPVYYGCSALKLIMTQAAGFNEILPWLAGLLIYNIVLFVINTLALKKYRSL